jgi:hypothetical protein
VVLNCGSSSSKFTRFDAGLSTLPRATVWDNKVRDIGAQSPAYGETGIDPVPVLLEDQMPYRAALAHIHDARCCG